MRKSTWMVGSLILLVTLACSASTWTELGPKYAGRVSGIVATDANHLWVASPGGGVWKSTDGGMTFAWAGNYALGDFTAVNLALDRNNPSRMHLRTWSGVLVSTDGAAHWTRTLYSLPQGDTPYPYPSYLCSSWPACPPFVKEWGEPGPFAQMVFSPTQSVILTALPCQGLQYSTDSGSHFTQLWPFSGAPQQRVPDNCISAVAADDTTHQVWIATMEDSVTHIYRSHQAWTTGGPPVSLTWDLVNSGITSSHPAIALAWGGSANKVMALVTTGSGYEAFLFNPVSGNWVDKPWNNADCVFRDARALVWGGGNDFFAGGVTFAATNNSGDTWNCPLLGQQYVDIRAIFASAALHSVWIGGDQNQFGNDRLLTRYTWNPGSVPSAPAGITGNGITTWQSYSIGQGFSTNRLVLGAQDIGCACSDNLGGSFSLTATEETQSVVWPQSGGSNTVYVYGTKGTLQKATNATSAANCAALSWSDVTPPDSFRRGQALTGAHNMAVRPNDPSKVFIINGGIVVYSTTGGTSWASSSVPLTVSGGRPVGLTAIMVDENGVLYVGTQDHGVYTCSDTTHFCDGSVGAGTWTEFALNPGGPVTPPAFITAIAESNPPPAARNFWIASSSGIFRRLSGATTAWAAVDAISLYPYSDVAVDPTCRTRIYSAVGYLANVTRTRGGVHVSTDNGGHWTSITSGFPLHNVPITQVLVDRAHPQRLFASTYGRGAWLYTWDTVPACAP